MDTLRTGQTWTAKHYPRATVRITVVTDTMVAFTLVSGDVKYLGHNRFRAKYQLVTNQRPRRTNTPGGDN